MIQGSDGPLYGTSRSGGPGGAGIVYKVQPDGSGFSILHGFDSNCTDGCYPQAGVIQGSDSALYGTTTSG